MYTEQLPVGNIRQKRGIVMIAYSKNLKSVIWQTTRNKKVKMYAILAVFFGIVALLVSFALPAYRGLVYLFGLTILCNTFIPIAPHEPVILLYGKLYSPWLVAICAAVAISVIELVNYRILTPILSLRKIGAFRERPFYRQAECYFNVLPSLSLIFACFTPVPFIPFRVLAVTTRYSIRKFILCVFLGRAPRFYLLALMGKVIDLPIWIYIVGLVLAFIIAMVKGLTERKKRSNKEDGGISDAICSS